VRTNTFAHIFEDKTNLYLQMEEHLTNVFYKLLHANPKEKAIIILESFYGQRALTEAIGHCCFKSFGTKCVYFVLSNALPLYATGMDTGIVVDCGF
jgi:actin-related protein